MGDLSSSKFRCYSELIQLPTFEERFRYLKLDGQVGFDTFGYDRWLNQALYHSKEWKLVRDKIIVRDNGCDLGVPGHDVIKPYLHHMNPVSRDDILQHSEAIFDPEFIILVSLDTHNAIHYGTDNKPRELFADRKPNDTCPWK